MPQRNNELLERTCTNGGRGRGRERAAGAERGGNSGEPDARPRRTQARSRLRPRPGPRGKREGRTLTATPVARPRARVGLAASRAARSGQNRADIASSGGRNKGLHYRPIGAALPAALGNPSRWQRGSWRTRLQSFDGWEGAPGHGAVLKKALPPSRLFQLIFILKNI